MHLQSLGRGRALKPIDNTVPAAAFSLWTDVPIPASVIDRVAANGYINIRCASNTGEEETGGDGLGSISRFAALNAFRLREALEAQEWVQMEESGLPVKLGVGFFPIPIYSSYLFCAIYLFLSLSLSLSLCVYIHINILSPQFVQDPVALLGDILEGARSNWCKRAQSRSLDLNI